jgi:hypothetical protein
MQQRKQEMGSGQLHATAFQQRVSFLVSDIIHPRRRKALILLSSN